MRDESNIFVIGLDMEGQTPEMIARKAALKIIGITDELIERQRVQEEKIKSIADKADLIVNGYAFFKKDNTIKVKNLKRAEKVTILDMDGLVVSTTMDEIEVDIVLDYYNRNRKYII